MLSLVWCELTWEFVGERHKHSCRSGVFHELREAFTSTYEVAEAKTVNDNAEHWKTPCTLVVIYYQAWNCYFHFLCWFACYWDVIERENVIFWCGVFPKGQKLAERTATMFPSQSISWGCGQGELLPYSAAWLIQSQSWCQPVQLCNCKRLRCN